MKVAISSENKDENSDVSIVSGRAPFYLLFDNGKLVKILKNPFRVGGGGAGFSVAQMLADEEVEVVISGKFGENMKGALKSKCIKYREMKDIKIREALEAIK